MPSGYHERRLPHWQPEDAALFITWRLYGSLPDKPDVIGLKSPGQAFAAFDRELAKAAGPRWLEDARVAQCVADVLEFGERELKPNHVHILVYPAAVLPQIAKTIKNFSARKANEILDRLVSRSGRTSITIIGRETRTRWGES